MAVRILEKKQKPATVGKRADWGRKALIGRAQAGRFRLDSARIMAQGRTAADDGGVTC
jgi:hypothetical protein